MKCGNSVVHRQSGLVLNDSITLDGVRVFFTLIGTVVDVIGDGAVVVAVDECVERVVLGDDANHGHLVAQGFGGFVLGNNDA